MGALAHALEGAGLATVGIALNLQQAQGMRPPRMLYCDFPLGRPLGKPGDAAFQRRVLDAAFSLLERPEGPVLETFPEAIDDASDSPLTCPLPPRFDPDLPAAVDEARGLRPAWDRALARNGGTQLGRTLDADGVPDAVAAFVRIAEGTALAQAGLPGEATDVAMDVRIYYEEAALALADHVPAARAAESWVYRSTELGRVLKQAQLKLRESEYPGWLYVLPMTQMEPSGG